MVIINIQYNRQHDVIITEVDTNIFGIYIYIFQFTALCINSFRPSDAYMRQ